MHKRRLATTALILLSLLCTGSLAPADIPSCARIKGIARVKQLRNYCGPAVLASILQFLGEKTSQEAVGKAIYDSASGATNGADMLLYARERGFAAYSWNADIDDVKDKIAQGIPVIVLQQNSFTDTSGHYRILTGYDDAARKFDVIDPYYDYITQISYADCERLWTSMGNWALLIVPAARDRFKEELGERNPVVHMDLAYANYKRREYQIALNEANLALNLEPRNSFALSMLDKIQHAIGAGAR